MSLLAYTITHGGETKSMADWGIEAATLRLSVGGDDELSLTMVSEITAAAVFTPMQPIVLKDRDGVKRFTGVAIPRREGYRMGYRCPGPNWYLERAYLTQEHMIWGGESFTLLAAAKCRLGVDNVDVELAACMAAVNAHVSGTVALGGQVPTYRNPEQVELSLRVLDAVQSILGWSPHLDYVWDYSGSTPTLTVFSVLRSGHGYGALPDNDIGTKTVALAEMQHAPAPVFEPRYDLLFPELKIYWLSWEAGVDVSSGSPVLRFKRETDTATASPSNGSFGRIELALPLRRDVFNATATPGDAELTVANLATRLGAPYFSLWLDFSFAVKGESCDFTHVPGQLVSASDADPLYASADSLCHTVTHDLATGLTQVECGAPRTLDFHDPRLNARLRRVSDGSDAGGQTYGFAADTDGSAGGGNLQIVVFERNTVTGELTRKWVTIAGTPANPTDDELKIHGVIDDAGDITHKLVTVIGKAESPT